MRRDATRCDAFVERRDPRGLSTSNGPTSRSPSRRGSGDRVMDGTRWKISTIPSRARSRAESNSFPIERGAARGGGPGVCLIRGNILVSRRITSYVCINLSCPGTESRAHSRRGRRHARTHARRQAGTHDRASRLNEHYSIIFKFNEFLVNNINEPYGIGRCRRITLIKI